jgi:membrane protease YdiL (CAAX protease family)
LERLRKFIRSVLPVDLTQLIFLGGVLCLIIAPHLRWWPAPVTNPQSLETLFGTDADQQAQFERWRFFIIAVLPIIFAYGAGIFVSFWPGKRPVRRTSLFVLLPAIGGIGWICEHFVSLQTPRGSIFLSGSARLRESFDVARTTLWTLGPGFRICLLGIVLILVFIWRIIFRTSSLPIAVPSEGNLPDDADTWHRARLLIWFSVAPGFVAVSAVISILTIIFQSVFRDFTGREIFVWQYGSANVVLGCAFIGAALWISGPAGRQATVRALRWCQPSYLLLAAAFAFGIDFAVSAGKYLFDYFYWSAHFYGRLAPPHIDVCFSVPSHSFQFLIGIVFGVLAEEITFRAILQQWLIQRYGIWRGLFFVGAAWSAIHFYTDFNLQMTELDALLGVCQRIFMCLALGFVFGWLTLRTKSIWPAVISHASFNILASSPSDYQFTERATVRAALWALLAYILFRYWPVQADLAADVELDLPSDAMEIGPA